MNWAVVMAGGVGTRFWPLSRERSPKQLLPIMSRKTMIEETIARLTPLVPASRILIVTGRLHKPLIGKVLKNLPPENIIAEPLARNTAPCLALAAAIIRKKDPRGVFTALPADQNIPEAALFRAHLKAACQLASERRHVVFGIQPTHPHTGFGYIEAGSRLERAGGIDVLRGVRFVEKPTLDKARAFLKNGRYYWNSGMFAWNADFFLESLKKHCPEMKSGIEQLVRSGGKNAAAVFRKLPSISVDYALMEKVRDFCVLKSTFRWNDVGSWQQAPQTETGGETIVIDSERLLVRPAAGRIVAAVGVRDLIVVDTPDAVLVCARDKAQDVKKVVDELRRRGLKKFL